MDEIRIKNKVHVVKFIGKVEGEIIKYQHVILTLDYTACGNATDEYDCVHKVGKVTCPRCIQVLEELIKFYKIVKSKEVDVGK